jgi:hypothetical protein
MIFNKNIPCLGSSFVAVFYILMREFRLIVQFACQKQFQSAVDGRFAGQAQVFTAFADAEDRTLPHAAAHHCGTISDGFQHGSVAGLRLRVKAMRLRRMLFVCMIRRVKIRMPQFFSHFPPGFAAILYIDYQKVRRPPKVSADSLSIIGYKSDFHGCSNLN